MRVYHYDSALVKRSKIAADVEAMVEELAAAARALGFEIREEELLREVGYRARSGACRFNDRNVILLDRRLGPAERARRAVRARSPAATSRTCSSRLPCAPCSSATGRPRHRPRDARESPMTVSHRVQEERFGAFKRALKERGLKSTSQRDDIARVFFGSNRHISVEELYREVRKVNPRVGYATVYRTVRLLRECGLAAERHFYDGEARFENVEERAPPRSPDLRALRADRRVRERRDRAAAGDGRAQARLRDQPPQDGALRHLRRLPCSASKCAAPRSATAPAERGRFRRRPPIRTRRPDRHRAARAGVLQEQGRDAVRTISRSRRGSPARARRGRRSTGTPRRAGARDRRVAVADRVGEAPQALAALARAAGERRHQLERDAAEAEADVHRAALRELAPPSLRDRERVAPETRARASRSSEKITT